MEALSWEQLNKLHMLFSCILHRVKICYFSPRRSVCKLEMYSINTGVLLLTFYSEQLPLKQSTLCIEFKTRVSEQQKKPNKQIDSNSIICPHVFILEHAM